MFAIAQVREDGKWLIFQVVGSLNFANASRIQSTIEAKVDELIGMSKKSKVTRRIFLE